MKKRFLLLCLLFLVALPTVGAKEPEDFFQEATEGGLTGYTRIHKFGHTDNVTRNTYVDVWETGGVYPHVALDVGATLMNVSSTDADDVAGGNGAWNITIEGLDGDWLEITEVVQLNGQTPVLTSNSFIRVNRAYIRQTGSSLRNEGDIYIGQGVVTAGVPNRIIGHISFDSVTSLGMGQTHMAIYSVPVNKTAYLWDLYTTTDVTKAFEVNLQVREFGEGWRVKEHFHILGQNIILDYPTPRPIPQRSDVKLTVRVPVIDSDFSGGFDLILLDNADLGLASEDELQDPTILFAVILGVVIVIILFLVWGKR